MKKKILIVCMFIIFAFGLFTISYTHFSKSSKKNENKNVVEIEKEVHNSKIEETIKQQSEDSEDKTEGYEQETKKETKKVESNTHNSNKKTNSKPRENTTSNTTQNNRTNNASSTNNNTSNSSNNSNNSNSSGNQNTSNETNSNEPINQDEKLWEEFKNDPFVLMVLEADSIDWESKSEQDIEANKWINLGYRVEMPYQCIYLSSGTRCVYGLVVYLPKGVCNETPNEMKIDWRKRNYIGIVTYAKNLGYSCEGYHD